MKASVLDRYKTACATMGIAQNSFICKGLEKQILHVRVGKIQPEEWTPIIKCLENNSSISEVIIEATVPTHCAYVKRSTTPSFTLTVKNQFMKSLSSCLVCSSAIHRLSIISVPLKKTQLEHLSRGLSRNQSLEFLCLKGSVIGQKAFNEIFATVRTSLNITHLDFSYCKLSDESCSHIGALLRSQTLERHTQTWKHTLRYNNPDAANVTGLKRITLNGNPIGDEGCEVITDAMQDDYWIRALDLQQCDITDEGAKLFLILLEDNACISVLDLRMNPQIKDGKLLEKINDCLDRNKQNDIECFAVGELQETKKAPKPKKTPRRSISNINLRNSLNEARTPKKANESKAPKKVTQYENYYNSMLKNSVVKNIEHLNDISLHNDKDKFSPILIHQTPPVKQAVASKHQEEKQIFSMLDELKNDLEIYKKELYLEKEKTKVLQSQVNALERENLFLKNQQQIDKSELEPELLDTIETSFSQFHNFLDMLKQAGYGDLCQLVNK